MISILGLLARRKSFWYPAITGWIVECIVYSSLGYFYGWTKNYFDESYIITYDYQLILIALSIVLFKIISIAYFTTKKLRKAFKYKERNYWSF